MRYSKKRSFVKGKKFNKRAGKRRGKKGRGKGKRLGSYTMARGGTRL